MITDISSMAATPAETWHLHRSPISQIISSQSVLVSSKSPEWTWQTGAIRKLFEFLSLRANWDSYGSEPVSPVAVFSAISFLDRLPLSRIPAPIVIPLPNGAVQMEWTKAEKELDLEFSPNGDISFVKVEGDDEADEEPLHRPGQTEELFSWLVNK